MISVLCPSRDRPALLRESLDSLGDGDYEFLVWLDDDEPQLLEYKDMLKDHKYTVQPRVGYKEFHTMVNYLAEMARGEWLLLWNDDALVERGNVSDLIHAQDPDQPIVLNFYEPNSPQLNLFPAISRALYEAMGHFSLSTHCDSWVQDIANELGIHKALTGIDMIHRRNALNDRTKEDSQNAYATTSPAYDSSAMIAHRKTDIERIRGLL